jgi:thioredoxin 1
MGKYVNLTDSDFDAQIAKGLTLVDFWAEWCGPCKMVAPTIEKLAEEFDGKVKIAKLDVDANQQTQGKFRVMSIPTVILFKDGQPVEVQVGADMSGNKYRAMINKHLVAAVQN